MGESKTSAEPVCDLLSADHMIHHVRAALNQWANHALMAGPFFAGAFHVVDHGSMIHHMIHTVPATRDQLENHGL